MNEVGSCKIGSAWKNEIYVALRVLAGFIFLYHGYHKVFGMGIGATQGFFESVGIPAAGLLAPIVSYGEIVAGLMIMVGLYTHWAAKFSALVMVGAIFFVHLKSGFNGMDGGYEYQLLLLVVYLYIAAVGSGVYSIDARRNPSKTNQ